MNTTEFYRNQAIDAEIMSRTLQKGRDITTGEAVARIESLNELVKEGIRNYKDIRNLESERDLLLLLLKYRAHWNEYCFDDCSHWTTEID